MSSDESKARGIAGVCAAAVTPLDAFDAPDPVATVVHCRRLFALGCDAINLLGTTGEAMSFSVAQRLSIMEAVAGSGLPLEACIVGTGASALADSVVLTRAAADFGFAGALVMPPFYFKDNTDDGILRFFSRLFDLVDRPALGVYLYHFPYLSGISFSPALVARLCDEFSGRIVGLKDSSGVAGYAESIVAAAPLAVFPSSETTLSAGRARGFAGCISATLNISAPLAAAVWRGAESDPDGPAAGDQEQLSAVRRAVAAYPLVPALRSVLASFSGDAAWKRMMPPLQALGPADETALAARLADVPAFPALREAFACA